MGADQVGVAASAVAPGGTERLAEVRLPAWQLPDAAILHAFRFIAGGATHVDVNGRQVERGDFLAEATRRGLDTSGTEPIYEDPKPLVLEVDQYDNYLCPLPDGQGSTCRAILALTLQAYTYVGPDMLDDDFTQPVTPESWELGCTNGHVLAQPWDEGVQFNLRRYLAGEPMVQEGDDE